MKVARQVFRIKQFFLTPFANDQKLDWRLVILFLLINALVFYNVILHDPRIGYDAKDHLNYMQVLSQGRLPDQADTREFFVPPLPYTFGALAQAVLGISTFKAARLSQVVNGLLSAGLLFLLLKTCLLASPRLSLRFGTLSAIGILPVYYRSFSLIRGEPYLAFFAVLVLYLVLKVVLRRDWRLAQMILLGTGLGLGALSRQWGFFFFPAVGILLAWEWLRCPSERWAIARGILAVFLIAGILSSLFYAGLYVRYGTITAFNRPLEYEFSFSNQPQDFYLGLNPQQLFSQPVRPNFANQLWPILYSDTWGDYWEYFSIYGRDIRDSSYLSGLKLFENLEAGQQHGWLQTNYQEFSGYLGRVNLVALFPSLLVIFSIGFAVYHVLKRGRVEAGDRKLLAFSLLAVLATLAGYGWFLIQYPNGRGDTIKATYILQIYPFLAVLLGSWLSWIELKNRYIFLLLLIGLGLVALHNLPTMVTHYILY